MKRLLLLSISLFVFSCSDDEDNVTVADLEGDWTPVSSCVIFTGECPPTSEFDDYCEDTELWDAGWYIQIEEGVYTDCNSETDTCDSESEENITINGNTATLCDSDNDCTTGTIELNGNTLIYSVSVTGYSEEYQDCTFELTLTATRL